MAGPRGSASLQGGRDSSVPFWFWGCLWSLPMWERPEFRPACLEETDVTALGRHTKAPECAQGTRSNPVFKSAS